ncbi:MAG: succinyl-diaminopimelate desuccinylase [bacterium]|nr:succinyl-diaminopimelate desuccinylase [bacterium]
MVSPPVLDLSDDVVRLAAALCDLPSVSGSETALADAIEEALAGCGHLTLDRDGDALVARTTLGRGRRVVIAGHIDTVPVKENLPTRLVGGELWGRGTVDMKSGVAVMLHLAARLTEPAWDVTWVFYDHEEVDYTKNGLGRVARKHPKWLKGDFAILMEPTAAQIEGGCNGTMLVEIGMGGITAHSARAWRGLNAIHSMAEILTTLRDYRAREVEVDGLVYLESLSAVGIHGGIATNMVPDLCTLTINYRFAPSTSVEEALEHLEEVFSPYILDLKDAVAGARPGLDDPLVAEFVAAVTASGAEVGPKYGWTDVARFSELGIPAVNYGPGDPMLAHADDERCPTSQIHACADALANWLTKGE